MQNERHDELLSGWNKRNFRIEHSILLLCWYRWVICARRNIHIAYTLHSLHIHSKNTMNQQKCRLFYYFHYLLNGGVCIPIYVCVLFSSSSMCNVSVLFALAFHLHHAQTQFNYGYCAVSVSSTFERNQSMKKNIETQDTKCCWFDVFLSILIYFSLFLSCCVQVCIWTKHSSDVYYKNADTFLIEFNVHQYHFTCLGNAHLSELVKIFHNNFLTNENEAKYYFFFFSKWCDLYSADSVEFW